jgi:hypothetical protein
MHDSETPRPYELLLDLHLDRLGDAERRALEAALERDPILRRRSERLGRVLQPLDSFTPAPTSAGIADRVLARISESQYARSPAEREAATEERLRSRLPMETRSIHRPYRPPFFAMRDLIGAAACILLLLSVFVPGLSGIRDRARRTVCADHLGSIYRGSASYAADFAESLPFAGCAPGAAWLPGDTDRPFASNSRHVYLLLKNGYGPRPADFLCPSDDGAEPLDPSDVSDRCDFASARNVSFDSLNLAAKVPNLRITPTRVYLGDRNPLFVRARFDDSVDPDTTNSPAHGGRGQMVLALNGNARWLTRPLLGKKRDNLWLAGDIRRYVGTEIPIDPDDVQLIPGFPAGSDPSVSHATPTQTPARSRNRY